MRLLVLLSILIPALVFACHAPEESACAEAWTSEIVNGTALPNSPSGELLDRSQNAVVALKIGSDTFGWNSLCTGSIITPRHVLTAAHCVYSMDSEAMMGNAGNFRVHVGADSNSPQTTFSVGMVSVHPDYLNQGMSQNERSKRDVAILTLTAAISSDFDFLFRMLPIDESGPVYPGRANDLVQSGGYGLNDSAGQGPGDGRRWWTNVKVLDSMWLDNTRQILVTPVDSGTGICYGDSGGPLIAWNDDGSIVQIGIASSILPFFDPDNPCTSPAIYTQIAPHMSWINLIINEFDLICGRLGPDGECSGNMAVYCENGSIIEDDCSLRECSFCAKDSVSGFLRCSQ